MIYNFDLVPKSAVIMSFVFAIIVPYLICGINPAIIAAKIKSGKDIREMGSGNPGLTNTFRTMGKGTAAVVLLFDVLKGVISILLVYFVCDLILPDLITSDDMGFIFTTYEKTYLLMWVGSLSGVLGHCYPVWYKFKGGKAVLVTVATGLVINWLAALIALSIFVLLVWITRYVSLSSIIAATCYVFAVMLTEAYVIKRGYVYGTLQNEYSQIGTIFCGAIALILIFKHRGNIKRLLNGTEKKFGVKES